MCNCGNTRVERTPNKSQHTKLTLEKKILPTLPPGFELATFRSRVRLSYQQAIPAPMANSSEIHSVNCQVLADFRNRKAVFEFLWKKKYNDYIFHSKNALTLLRQKFSEDLKTILFKFLWNGRPDRRKRTTVQEEYHRGGLKMLIFSLLQ